MPKFYVYYNFLIRNRLRAEKTCSWWIF